MKYLPYLLAGVLGGGMTLKSAGAAPANVADSETVMVTYRPKAGKEAELLGAIQAQWRVLKKLQLARPQPHVVVRGKEAAGGIYVVEIFTWVSADIPDHAPAEVQAIWAQFNRLCQTQTGHPALEITEVEPVVAGG